jgi:hypothetical protein
MALSPADFYAYSRATGTPFPENAEERAQIAPEVLEFRRNQLKRKEEDFNVTNALGTVAALAGIGAGGYGLTQLFRKNTPIKKTYTPSTEAESVVRKVTSVLPSKTTTPNNTGYTINDLWEDPETVVTKGTSRSTEFSPRSYIEETGSIAPASDLTSIQQSQLPLLSAQQQAAVESGEDQTTARIKRHLQQNEGLDPSQIDVLEEIAEKQYRIGMEQEDPAIQRVISSQEFVERAKQYMIERRQELEARGLRPGTLKFERALAKSFVNKSASGVEPGTAEFRNLQDLNKIDFSLPSVIRNAVDITVDPEDALQPKRFRLVPNIGPLAGITKIASKTSVRGASPVYHEAFPTTERTRQLFGLPDDLVPGAPDELGPDIPGSRSASRYVFDTLDESGLTEIVQKIKENTSLTDEQKKNLIAQLDEQKKNLIAQLDAPGSQPKGGSAGIGVYGIEPKYVPGAVSKNTGEYSNAATQKPSYVPSWILRNERILNPYEGVSDEGLRRAIAKSSLPRTVLKIKDELTRRENARESVLVSEALRRAYIEGRNPKI